jgi:predicted transposase/invertase (TIGR01784 family)
LFYTSRLISGLAPKGNRSAWAYNIAEVYLIALLEDFTLEDSPANTYLHDICLCNRDTGQIFYDKLGFTYIELSRFVKTETELETDLDRWLHVLKNMSRMDKIPSYLKKPIFEKLFSIAEYTNLTKEEKTMYDTSLKYKWDNKNVLDYAVQEAREEERIKAFEEKKAIAGELKKEGLALDFIAKTTKLTIEEIEKL